MHPASEPDAAAPLLSVRDLSVTFRSAETETLAVSKVSFDIHPGETVALVGESGSGKSVTALSTLRLLPGSAEYEGSVRYQDAEVFEADEPTLRGIRGDDISMIFQEPMTSLNPLHTVEKQVTESLELHQGLSGAPARERVLELLNQVGLRDAESRLGAYPHQLSGGQRQRVMIAMALANNPKLLIADEPTTALDVTIQAQILVLLKDLQRERGMAMLFITHDLGIVRKIADKVCVMQGGEIVETGPTAQLFDAPQHPYSKLLLGAEPKGRADPLPEDAQEILNVEKLKVWFPIKRGLMRTTVGHVKAVLEADLTLRAGETLGVVGESGSGKTTLGLAILRLIRSEGRITALGQELQGLGTNAMRPLRRDMQIVFQDPYGSLSPRMSIAQIIGEGLDVHGLATKGEDRRAVITEALEEVGLDPESMDRYPHEFSGGQRQRVAIARAMILKPKFMVLDEPTSALDMTVQVQIVELLRELQRKYGLSYLFISHDLRVVRAMSHRIMVMRAGEIVEAGQVEQIVSAPNHDYTKALMAAAFNLETHGSEAIAD
ncbi:MAG: ABC transporter ATP-binding protein [Rhodobacteraceae bacterium]|nr:ABC transporter ATP-binding protein [Paracoccaceae bacterium]